MSSRVKLKDGRETLIYRALTWDHPRGFNALDAAAQTRLDGFVLHWDKQPLSGFEEHSIADRVPVTISLCWTILTSGKQSSGTVFYPSIQSLTRELSPTSGIGQ